MLAGLFPLLGLSFLILPFSTPDERPPISCHERPWMSTSASSAHPRCCYCSWDEPLVRGMHFAPSGWALLSPSCHALLLSLHKDAGEVNFLKHASDYITCWLKFFSTWQAITVWVPSTQWWAEASTNLAASLLAPLPACPCNPQASCCTYMGSTIPALSFHCAAPLA